MTWRRALCWLLGHRHAFKGMERTAVFYCCARCGDLVPGRKFHNPKGAS
jgi:hypothetical protein